MLSRWKFARLKVAENALDAGRISEAYERLSPPDVRKLNRAQKLLDLLAKSLLARARLHARAGRYSDALSDLLKLDSIDRMDADAKTLRRRVEEEQGQRVRRHADQGEAFDRAAGDLKAGHLESGRAAIERLEDPQQRERLREELDIRVQRSGQLLDQARASLDAGDALTACRFWREAQERHGRTSESDALAALLAQEIGKILSDAFGAGRLDSFVATLETANELTSLAPALRESVRLGRLVREAARGLAAGDHGAVREALLRLHAARGDAKWITAALKPLEDIDRARAQLLSSPLGLLGTSLYKTAGFPTATPRESGHNYGGSSDETPGGAGASLANEPLLLLVDGTGSGVIAAHDVVRIGRAGSVERLDVPIPADIQSHHADVIRDGEDYFLVAHGPAKVNHRVVNRTLLRHGDRITLGSAAKMVFHKPSAKSDTAVLQLSSRCRLPQDVSFVVMFKGTCLIGPQASCHVRTREGDTRLVLFDRDGGLYVRRAARDGRPTGPAEAAPADQTCDFGDVRLTVKKYRVA